MNKKMVLFPILITALSLFFVLPQPLQFIFGFMQIFILPGMLFLVLFGKLFSSSDRIIYSILFSPIILSILIIFVNILTGDVYYSMQLVLITIYLMYALVFFSGKNNWVQEKGEKGNISHSVFFVSISYGLLILISYLMNDFLLIRSDAWYHAAVVEEIINRGIPPNEPFLGDFSIQYMWFYHLFQACWIKQSGLSTFWSMGTFNIINAIVFPYLVMRYISFFTTKKHVILFVTLISIAGLQSASWILWPVQLARSFIGEVTGMAEVKRILANTNINGAEVVKFLTPPATWQVQFIDKFLTITVFNYSLNLFLSCIIMVLSRDLLKNARYRTGAIIFTIVLGTSLFHVVTGIVLIASIIGSIILIFLINRFVSQNIHYYRGYTFILITALLNACIVLPYLFSIISTGNGSGQGSFIAKTLHFGIRNILTIFSPLIILFFPARAAFKKLFSGTDYRSVILSFLIICLGILCFFINIGVVGEKKLVFLLFLLVGPLIFIQIIKKINNYKGFKKWSLIGLVMILFLFPPFLIFRGFIIDEPNNKIESTRYYISDKEKDFYKWIRKNTPVDAVIVENNIYHLSPVYSGRRNLYSWHHVITNRNFRGEKLQKYRNIQISLFGKNDIPKSVISYMNDFDHPLYIAVRNEDFESCPWLKERFSGKSEFFEKVHSSGGIYLYSLIKNSG